MASPEWWRTKHRSTQKTDDRPCSRCQMLYPSISRLTTHLEVDHGIKPFEARQEATKHWITHGVRKDPPPITPEPPRSNPWRDKAQQTKPKPDVEFAPAIQPKPGESTDEYLARAARKDETVITVDMASSTEELAEKVKNFFVPPAETVTPVQIDPEPEEPAMTKKQPKELSLPCKFCSFKATSYMGRWRHIKKEHPDAPKRAKKLPVVDARSPARQKLAEQLAKQETARREVEDQARTETTRKARRKPSSRGASKDFWALLDQEIEAARDEYTRLNLEAEKANEQVQALEKLKSKLQARR